MSESSEEKTRKAYLTEKFHLNKEEDGTLSFDFKGFKGAIINFSDPEVLLLLSHYKNAKEEFSVKLKNIALTMGLPFAINDTLANKLYNTMESIIEVALTIFKNTLVDGWEESMRSCPTIQNYDFLDMLRLFMDLINCIDIAIFAGVKKIQEKFEGKNINTIKINENDELEVSVHVVSPNGEVVEQVNGLDEMFEIIIESIKNPIGNKIIVEQANFNDKNIPTIDLLKMKPMGNA